MLIGPSPERSRGNVVTRAPAFLRRSPNAPLGPTGPSGLKTPCGPNGPAEPKITSGDGGTGAPGCAVASPVVGGRGRPRRP